MQDSPSQWPFPLPNSHRSWRAGLLTQVAWPQPVVLSPFKRLAEPIGRFLPIETESTLKKGVSRHLSFSPTLTKEKRGDLLELKELIELSFREKGRKKQHQKPIPPTSPPKRPTETKENRESLSDTIDSQVLNIELHYQENLDRAGQPFTPLKPVSRGCPLQAVRSYGGNKSKRSPLPLHGVMLPSPGKVLGVEKSMETQKSATRKRPSSLYRLRVRRDIPHPHKNSDCLHISRMHYVPPASALTCTVSSRLVPLALKSTESDDSDSDPVISRPNLTVQ